MTIMLILLSLPTLIFNRQLFLFQLHFKVAFGINIESPAPVKRSAFSLNTRLKTSRFFHITPPRYIIADFLFRDII